MAYQILYIAYNTLLKIYSNLIIKQNKIEVPIYSRIIKKNSPVALGLKSLMIKQNRYVTQHESFCLCFLEKYKTAPNGIQQ